MIFTIKTFLISLSLTLTWNAFTQEDNSGNFSREKLREYILKKGNFTGASNNYYRSAVGLNEDEEYCSAYLFDPAYADRFSGPFPRDLYGALKVRIYYGGFASGDFIRFTNTVSTSDKIIGFVYDQKKVGNTHKFTLEKKIKNGIEKNVLTISETEKHFEFSITEEKGKKYTCQFRKK